LRHFGCKDTKKNRHKQEKLLIYARFPRFFQVLAHFSLKMLVEDGKINSLPD